LAIWRSLSGVQGCHTAAEKRAVAAGEAQSPDAIAPPSAGDGARGQDRPRADIRRRLGRTRFARIISPIVRPCETVRLPVGRLSPRSALSISTARETDLDRPREMEKWHERFCFAWRERLIRSWAARQRTRIVGHRSRRRSQRRARACLCHPDLICRPHDNFEAASRIDPPHLECDNPHGLRRVASCRQGRNRAV